MPPGAFALVAGLGWVVYGSVRRLLLPLLQRSGCSTMWCSPLVGLAAGSLLGGALFHMLLEAIQSLGNSRSDYVWLVLSIVSSLLLEQHLQGHRCYRAPRSTAPVGVPGADRRPLYLVGLVTT